MNEREEFVVTFLPSGRKIACAAGDELIESARRHGIRIASDCGAAAVAVLARSALKAP